MAPENPKAPRRGPGKTPRRPDRLRPPVTAEETAEEFGGSLVGIDNPDDADIYPPTETPTEGDKRRKGFPPRTDRRSRTDR